MPNWCNNQVEISHDDVTKMEALVAAINDGKFCNHVIPTPESLHITAGREGADGDPKQIALEAAEKSNLEQHGYANWYDFQVARWGTKWDVDAYDTVTLDGNGIQFGFDSAWSPPIGVYEALVEQGFRVKAFYYESGMCFGGVWDNGNDDFYDFSQMTSAQVAVEIDPELDEVMCISENMANYEELDEDEE